MFYCREHISCISSLSLVSVSYVSTGEERQSLALVGNSSLIVMGKKKLCHGSLQNACKCFKENVKWP